MDLLTVLASPALLPFSIALSLVLALLILELGMSLIGGSLLGQETGLELDAEAEFDFEIEPDFDAAVADLPDNVAAADGAEAGGGGVLSWLGLGKAPFGIWLAGVLTAFGVSGNLIQSAIHGVFGQYLPGLVAVMLALPLGIGIGARFAGAIGRAIPKNETTAISTRSYGGRRGVITVGTSARGRPAQVRFKDGHGNLHHAMIEPLHDHETFGQGTEVAILRLKNGALRAVGLGD